MKRPNIIIWGGVALCAVCCFVTLGLTLHVWFATKLSGSPTFTVDEVLACLTVAVALVGIIVAVAAIGIGMAAIFGYAELRTMTFRKTEDQLRQIIANLEASGDLAAAAAKVLQTSIEIEPKPRPRKKTTSTSDVSEAGTEPGTESTKTLANQYPKNDKG